MGKAIEMEAIVVAYFLETDDRDLLKKLRLTQVCAECGGELEAFYSLEKRLPYLQCKADPQHQGIAKVQRGGEYNILSRRDFMEQKHGSEKALALRRFDAVATLDRKSAREILTILWPKAENASPAEFAKALGLCVDYGLDPRLNELFLIPFKKRDKETGKVVGTSYETVRGIRATRKVALRRHHYSYIDFTPRLMTKEEEERVYSKANPDRIRYITKLKDMDTGAEAPGYGEWPKTKTVGGKQVTNNPKGMDKGNSMENMASIRSERNALERAYPADMPPSRIPVVDEQFIEGEYHEITDTETETEEESETETETTPSKDFPAGGEKTGELTGNDKDAKTETAHDKAPTTDEPPKSQAAPTVSSPPKGKDEKSKIPPRAPAAGQPQFPLTADLVTAALLKDDILTLYYFSYHYWGFQPEDVAKELGYTSPVDLAKSKPKVWDAWLTIKKAGEERRGGQQR
jgi:hypothetical protein